MSRQARLRLKWFDYYQAQGRNARLTCRHFGISPQTFYRWKRRYDPKGLSALEDCSHRPKHVRQPTVSTDLVNAMLKTKEERPRWGKEKIARLLSAQSWQVSVSIVGRILKRLKERGVLKEPIWNTVSVRKEHRPRPYATRKPREFSQRTW